MTLWRLPGTLYFNPAGRLTNTSGSVVLDFLNLFALTFSVLIALSLLFLESHNNYLHSYHIGDSGFMVFRLMDN